MRRVGVYHERNAVMTARSSAKKSLDNFITFLKCTPLRADVRACVAIRNARNCGKVNAEYSNFINNVIELTYMQETLRENKLNVQL